MCMLRVSRLQIFLDTTIAPSGASRFNLPIPLAWTRARTVSNDGSATYPEPFWQQASRICRKPRKGNIWLTVSIAVGFIQPHRRQALLSCCGQSID